MLLDASVSHDWNSFGIALAIIGSYVVTWFGKRSSDKKAAEEAKKVAVTLETKGNEAVAATTKVAEVLAASAGESKETLKQIHSAVNSHSEAQEREIVSPHEEIRVLVAASAKRESEDVAKKITELKEEIESLKKALKANGHMER